MESPTSVPPPLQLSTSSPSGSPGLSPSASPSRSRASSRASHLTLDLSCVSPILPSPPTNTLLITGINDVEVFSPPNIARLRDVINRTAPLASWSPLKSFRRIVCSFATVDDAVAVREALDGEALLGSPRLRVYFGEHTPLHPDGDRHLHAPEAKKLFFISPPPSPPHGWESKPEDPPNAVVVAEDLAHALARLAWEPRSDDPAAAPDPAASNTSTDPSSNPNSNSAANSASTTTADLAITARTAGAMSNGRSRSSSILLFEPEDDSKEAMPAISVDDYTDGSDDERASCKPASAHTSRPPVELIHDA